MSTPAFSRSRSPIRGSDGSVSYEAKWRAGYTYARRAAADRDPQRVVDPAAPDLLVAGEQRQDRQPGGVGRRPARRAHRVRAQPPGRARARAPGARPPLQVEQLVEPARAALDQQRVAVPVGVAPALDVDAARDRVADAVRLVRVGERHALARGALGYDVVRDPDRPALVRARAEVGVQALVEPDRARRSRPSPGASGGGRPACWSGRCAGAAGSRRSSPLAPARRGRRPRAGPQRRL